ncbi:MAG TPA: AbfB domain-containing protein [Ideonella sp.]|uniref:AbfB domain-containing protein n=1 Tax=Ideonella sp. TaxID=1929293 RepID=UPI002E33F8C6|nr:AbfB domain-containing protein [Ideonella sp.]HEX5682416.1 AbfB domain-containing protein [Ideonella sp.]
MKKIRNLFALGVGLIAAQICAAADWQLVWQDEFEGSISPDWVFEIGNGAGGWGNNELEYYRRENANVENGNLVITAKREDFGGFRYTSSRMKTQGKQSFKYGRIEARIKVPLGSGLWPAFWALGSNITRVGWPASGEIDILEHVNTEDKVYGTVHWSAPDGSYASYGGNVTTTPQDYHLYSIEWDPTAIRWFLDGVQYHVIDITDGVGGTAEFHNDFFLLLNLAVGGNWPGFNIDETKLPARMYVDYVRVYQKPGNESGITSTWALDNTTKVIRHQDGRAQLDKPAKVKPYGDGNWTMIPGLAGAGVSFQSENEPGHFLRHRNGELVLEANDNSAAFKNAATFYKRPGLTDEWAKSFEAYNLPGQYIRQKDGLLYVKKAGTDTAKKASTFMAGLPLAAAYATTVEAETHEFMSGVVDEACSEGGQDVSSIDAGDWMVWPIDLPSAGVYKVEYRVASSVDGGKLQLEKGGGNPVYGQLDVPNTNGGQNWTTISHDVSLDAGEQHIGLKGLGGSWSLNWLKISRKY